MITLRNQMEQAVALGRALFTKFGHLEPMVHAIDEADKHHICPLDGMPKDFAAFALRSFCADKGIVQLVYVAEAWVLRTKEVPDKIPDSLKNHPDRTEALVFHGENTTEQLAAEVPITRSGDQAELGQTEFWTPTIVAGRFVDLLKSRQGPNH